MSAQCFLKSLSADCCSSEVQIVFFDPETDFIVEPWIEKKYSGKLYKGQVVAGYDIDCEDFKIKLFGNEYEVVAKMSKTGTSLDSSVYFTMDSMEEILVAAEDKGLFLTDTHKNGNIISSIFINVSEETDINTIVSRCHVVAEEEFDVVYPKQLNESLSGNLNIITGLISTVTKAVCVVLFVILFVTNHVVMSMRKQEIALLRILGNTKRKTKGMILLEVCFVGIAGVLTGEFLGGLITLPFGNYIGNALGMPYVGPGFAEILVSAVITVVGMLFIIACSAYFSVTYVCNQEPYLALRKEAE